jgi:hypothetical protein
VRAEEGTKEQPEERMKERTSATGRTGKQTNVRSEELTNVQTKERLGKQVNVRAGEQTNAWSEENQGPQNKPFL